MSNRFDILDDSESDSTEKNMGSWRTNDSYYKRKRFMNKNNFSDDSKHKTYTNRNLKKILCNHIITYGTCTYGDKCDYAHSLDSQNMDNNRKRAYDVIINYVNLSDIDLQKDHSLYRTLLMLTKICELCDSNKCTGGYNCKYGACRQEYIICVKDLNYGNCSGDCKFVHLTKKGLRCFYYNSYSSKLMSNINKTTNIDEQKLNKNIKSDNIQENIIDKNIEFTLSNTEFFNDRTKFDDSSSEISAVSNDSDKSDIDDECNQSIFL